MGLIDWLKRKKPQSVWVIKQIDEGLLHLCGKGSVAIQSPAASALEQLRKDSFSGPVRMGNNGVVLNSAQFAALLPEQDLTLIDDNEAQWQGRRWQIAWVPQRCWLHSGRLAAQRIDFQGQPRQISIEDVSTIRAKAETPRQADAYIPLEPLESSRRWQSLDKDDNRS